MISVGGLLCRSMGASCTSTYSVRYHPTFKQGPGRPHCILVLSPKTRAHPEIMVCRILLSVSFFGPLVSLSQSPQGFSYDMTDMISGLYEIAMRGGMPFPKPLS